MPVAAGRAAHRLVPPTMPLLRSSRLLSAVRLLALAVAVLLSSAAALRAQDGTVTGHVWAERPGEALPFVLVGLTDAASGARLRTLITDSSGTFTFGAVAPGSYRLVVDRIGFERQQSGVVEVRDGATVRHDFTGQQRVVAIAPITATVGCYTVDRLGQDSALAAVWNEARKGVETRLAFDRQYAYAFDMRQRTVAWPVRGVLTVRDSATETYVNDPALAEQVARRRRELRRERGYGFTNGRVLQLEMPDESELLDDDFMRTHCIESGLEMVDGAWEVSFRPVRERSKIDVRGTLRLDSATFQVRSVSYEYVHGGRSFMRATVHYGDVELPGATLRLALRGEFQGRPVGRVGYTVRRVAGTVAYVHFRVAAPAPAATDSAESAPPGS
jgi:hypothetical protein